MTFEWSKNSCDLRSTVNRIYMRSTTNNGDKLSKIDRSCGKNDYFTPNNLSALLAVCLSPLYFVRIHYNIVCVQCL